MEELEKIRGIEKTAAENIEGAKRDANIRLKKIYDDRDSVIKDKEEKAEIEIAKMRAEEKKKSEEEAKKIVKEGEEKVKTIRASAEKNLDSAVKKIVEDFMKKEI